MYTIQKLVTQIYVRDIVLVDIYGEGAFTVKEWMGQNHYKSIYSNDGGKIITSNTNTEYNLKRGDVVLYRMVNIRCKPLAIFWYNYKHNKSVKSLILPETTVYYRFGSLVKKTYCYQKKSKKIHFCLMWKGDAW